MQHRTRFNLEKHKKENINIWLENDRVRELLLYGRHLEISTASHII